MILALVQASHSRTCSSLAKPSARMENKLFSSSNRSLFTEPNAIRLVAFILMGRTVLGEGSEGVHSHEEACRVLGLAECA